MIPAFRLSGICLLVFANVALRADVALNWLDRAPLAHDVGVSFGVPFAQGTMVPGQKFVLDTAGKNIAAQSWPLAYWPDGSLKWVGLATVVPAGVDGPFTLKVDAANAPSPSTSIVKVTPSEKSVLVDTGALQCELPFRGHELISKMTVGGREIARTGELVCVLQNGPATTELDSPSREKFRSEIREVVVEQSGPVRAVVRCEGMHVGEKSGRAWLPFTVRFYFYAGETSVRVVHSITFDGGQEKDFIRGLGLEFGVPLRETARERTVRFGGESGGIWSEPLQPGGGSVEQEAGEPFTPRGGFLENAIWDDFKLVQPNPDGFTVVKRTNPKSTWLFSAAGKRAAGFAQISDRTGGLGISVKNFWQSYPAALEVRHASSDTADLVAWLWSPDGPEMDMRHYDVKAHTLLASYEDVQPGMSTAFGVARTSELTLFPVAATPARTTAEDFAQAGEKFPLLVASPEYFHSTGVFGVWSLPKRDTAFENAIEDGLDSVLKYYETQVDQRDWYGFWQFGDFIHSYSAPRHVWHYDWGGHAWDNTELGAPLWLWYSFLRSGRADLFRLAEAHTRNTSETDIYHLGPMAGLGSRHNVIKWGDGAKEARISQAAHWRAYYYLTTDERTGDLMRATTTSDLSVARYDPMREAEPPVPGEAVFAARIRIGPDWFALAGNWMTEWERTGDVKWRDRILAGVNSIMGMPFWLQSGQLHGLNPDLPNGGVGPLKGGGSMTVGYDTATGKLTAIRDPLTKEPVPVSYNLATIQGGGEVMFELLPLLNRPDFAQAWLQYCRIANAPAEVIKRDQKTGTEGGEAQFVLTGQSGPRLAAYAYAHTGNPAFARAALAELLSQGGGLAKPREVPMPNAVKPLEEAPEISTNEAAQTGLSTIEVLEFCRDQLPTGAPSRIGPDREALRRGRGGRRDAPAPGSAANPAASATPTPAHE